jgi:LysM repeat protein
LPATSTYTVKSGDTLTKIARTVYGDPYKYPLIQQANSIDSAGHIWVGQVLSIPALSEGDTPLPSPPSTTTPETDIAPEPPTSDSGPCAPIPNVRYKLLHIEGPVTDRPAPVHADLNLSMRSYTTAQVTKTLIQLNGPTDSQAPQLRGLFDNKRIPAFPAVYQVYDWNWGQGAQGGRGNLLNHFEATLLGMTTKLGEIIYVPNAGYSIGDDMQVLLLYATTDRATIKYTREDNVVDGYTIHIEGICVDPTLQEAYQARDISDRRVLVALAAGAPLGRARSHEIKVAIRDKGRFMDPRSEKDWWRGV